MADDRNITIKKTDKESCTVIWGRNDYLMEAKKHLSDKEFYQEVSNGENISSTLTKMSNKMFSSLKNSGWYYRKTTWIFPLRI